MISYFTILFNKWSAVHFGCSYIKNKDTVRKNGVFMCVLEKPLVVYNFVKL